MRMVWGGNIIRPAAQAGHTHLTTVTHINPGGMGETRFGLVFLNAMAATGPRKFVNGEFVKASSQIPPSRARPKTHKNKTHTQTLHTLKKNETVKDRE
jgi:hypothetical protein